ncbi:MAG: hypothetical protein J0M12_15205 [Deltaproteobacteria bacterium]|nr:hypothetical protein [Deltaproteobacteria bacterium]
MRTAVQQNAIPTQSLASPVGPAPDRMAEALVRARPLSSEISLAVHDKKPILLIQNGEIAYLAFQGSPGNPAPRTAREFALQLRESAAAKNLFADAGALIRASTREMESQGDLSFGERNNIVRSIDRLVKFVLDQSKDLPATPITIVLKYPNSDRARICKPAEICEPIQNARKVFDAGLQTIKQRAGSAELRAKEITKIDAAQKALTRFEQIVTDWTSGKSEAEIRETHRIKTETVRAWLNGGLPSELTSMTTRAPAGRRAGPEISLPRHESSDWAYVLGAYQAATTHRGVASGFRVSSPLQEPITELAERMKALDIGLRVKTGTLVSHGQSRFFLRLSNTEFSRALFGMSSGNQRVIWQGLGSREEQLSYLRGLLSVRGEFSSGIFNISLSQHSTLAIQLAGLFQHLGVHTALSVGATRSLRVASYDGLKALHALDVLPAHISPRVAAHLAEKSPPRSRSGEEYDRVMAHLAKFPRSTNAHTSQVTGVPVSAIREWREGAIPRPERMKEQLGLDRLNVPNPEVAAFLYRSYEMTADECIALSHRFTLDEVMGVSAKINSVATVAPNLKVQALKSRLEALRTTPISKQVPW